MILIYWLHLSTFSIYNTYLLFGWNPVFSSNKIKQTLLTAVIFFIWIIFINKNLYNNLFLNSISWNKAEVATPVNANPTTYSAPPAGIKYASIASNLINILTNVRHVPQINQKINHFYLPRETYRMSLKKEAQK
jgi:hypothetical protein